MDSSAVVRVLPKLFSPIFSPSQASPVVKCLFRLSSWTKPRAVVFTMLRMSMFQSWKQVHTNLVIGIALGDLSIHRCISSITIFLTDRMCSLFSNAGSTFACMKNFALTQWITGASAAVFPGALPQIDATQDTIKQWIKNLYSTIWGQIAIGLVSTVFPPTTAILGDLENSNLGLAYQDLSNRGLLTANVPLLNNIR